MFLTLPGLTGRGQTMTGGCLPRDALPSSPGQGRQPAPRGEGRAPASRRQAPPGPCGAALGTAVPGPCLSAPAPPRAQSERVRKCVSCAGTFRLPRSLSQLFSETVTRSFPRTTHKLKNSQKDQKHIYTKLGHVAKLRRAFPKSTSLSGFPLFSRDPPPVLSVPVVSGVKGSRLSLPGGVSEARSWALKFQPLPQARQRRPRQRGGQAGSEGAGACQGGVLPSPLFWRPGPHVDLTAAGGGPVSPRRPGWLTTEPGTPSQKATRLRPLLPCPWATWKTPNCPWDSYALAVAPRAGAGDA